MIKDMFACQHSPLNFSTEKHNVFFTSDVHFNHGNIIKYCRRPFDTVEEMNEALIRNWNSVVGPEDVVFCLGDFMFGNINRFWDFRSRLNGKIYLVHGNHDWNLMDNGDIDGAFEMISAMMRINVDGQLIYLSHFPFLAYDGIYKEKKPYWQLFGHVHSNKNNIYSSPDIDRLKYLLPMQYDVGVDNNDYKPVSFAEVKAIIEAQQSGK